MHKYLGCIHTERVTNLSKIGQVFLSSFYNFLDVFPKIEIWIQCHDKIFKFSNYISLFTLNEYVNIRGLDIGTSASFS